MYCYQLYRYSLLKVDISEVPRVKTDFGRRAFSSAAPQLWNHILAAIKVSPSLDSFKRHLKTHYFTSL